MLASMNTWATVHLLAAASGLMVLALAIGRGPASRLRRPLALLALNQFAWNSAALGTALTGAHSYELLGAIAAPLFTPAAFHFVLRFLGRHQAWKVKLRGLAVLFGAQSLAATVEVFRPGTFSVASLSATLMLSSLPIAVLAFSFVLAHRRQPLSDLERLRTSVLLWALVLASATFVTDLLADLNLPVPRLATLGSFGLNVLLTHLTFGLGLLKNNTSRGYVFLQPVLFGLLFAVVYLAVVQTLSAQATALATALTVLSLCLVAVGALFVRSSTQARVGLERFATLGRFSAQMAHDLKNPLAAAKGAAEYLAEELRRAGQDSHHDFAQLLVTQLDRLHAVIDRYQRLSKLEPTLSVFDINPLVTRVLALQEFAATSGIRFETRLCQPGPAFMGDVDLVASALENLIKNAVEAMPQGGVVTVSTEVTEVDESEPTLQLAVSDTGHGFDARAREQAFELFFTTKASGSGMGLAFVREVARAHGGDAVLNSQENTGTTVTLHFPLRAMAMPASTSENP